MKFIGLIRKSDDLGRVCIPREYRKELGIKDNDRVEIFLTECGGIYIKKVKEEDNNV